MMVGAGGLREKPKVTDIRDREIERLKKENDDLRRLLFCEIYANIVRQSGVYALSGDMKESTIEDVESVILRRSYEAVENLLNPKGERYKEYDRVTRKQWEEVKKVFGE